MLFMDGWIRKLEIEKLMEIKNELIHICLLYTSPSPRD